MHPPRVSGSKHASHVVMRRKQELTGTNGDPNHVDTRIKVGVEHTQTRTRKGPKVYCCQWTEALQGDDRDVKRARGMSACLLLFCCSAAPMGASCPRGDGGLHAVIGRSVSEQDSGIRKAACKTRGKQAGIHVGTCIS